MDVCGQLKHRGKPPMFNPPMHSPPIPVLELARLQALRDLKVLDTLPEAFSNAVALAAASIANVPVTAISLIDEERQWFKSSCGLGVSETPRDVSFCGHAILDSKPLLVPDTYLDERFVDNPLVTGAPFIRSYAGFPLIVNGSAIGALCIIDDRPREHSAEQIERLQGLADITAAWLSERGSIVHQLTHSQSALQLATYNESVTGLPNRLAVQERLQAIRDGARTSRSAAVICVDIDGHNDVRARWGDETANVALRKFADRLATQLRPHDLIACAGGDQFIIVLEGVRAKSDAVELAGRLNGAIREPLQLTRCLISLTASIGVALSGDLTTVERLVSHADTAMRAVKGDSGDGHQVYDQQMGIASAARADLLDALRSALERNEFRLVYQPKIHAKSGQITGVEALIRWQRAGIGTVSPAGFISLAEETGLIDSIGQWVFTEACRQMSEWQRSGIRMRVAVNISALQLKSPSLANEISQTLNRFGVDPHLLTCEVTESVAMGDSGSAFGAFQKLKAIGVKLSIDDFGTGYSSLSYLRKLSVHQLKLDRSFVVDVGQNEDADIIAAAIVNLAHSLRLEVVAEGVETELQRRFLTDIGCDKLQGYLFAKPMTADDLGRWAQTRLAGELTFRDSIFAA